MLNVDYVMQFRALEPARKRALMVQGQRLSAAGAAKIAAELGVSEAWEAAAMNCGELMMLRREQLSVMRELAA